MLRLLSISAVVALLLGVSAVSVQAAEPVKPPPLVALEKEGVLVKYLGREQGQDGWMTVKNGRIEYMYTTPDQQGVVLGVMFDAKGDSVTAKQLQRAYHTDAELAQAIGANPLLEPPLPAETAGPAPTAAPAAPVTNPAEQAAKAAKGAERAEKLVQDLTKANGFDLGKPEAPVMYVMIDPQCSHCKDFLRKMRDDKHLDNGRVRLRVLPVAVINDKSIGQSASLLDAPNPQAMLWALVDGNQDAIPVKKDPNIDKVKANLELMIAYKFDVTPMIIYRGKDSKVKLVRGIPANFDTTLSDVAPQP